MVRYLREGMQVCWSKLEMMDGWIYQLDYSDGCMGVYVKCKLYAFNLCSYGVSVILSNAAKMCGIFLSLGSFSFVLKAGF